MKKEFTWNHKPLDIQWLYEKLDELESKVDALQNGQKSKAIPELMVGYDEEIINLSKDINKQPMTFVAPELSDEEIEKWVASTPYYGHCTPEYKEGLEDGAKWAREQLKSKQWT